MKNRKSGLLAAARGQERSRHDDRQSPIDGSGGEPTRDLHANPHGWFLDTLPQRQYLYGYVSDRWLGLDSRERVSHPDAASSALRIGYLRRRAPPDYARPIVASLHDGCERHEDIHE